MKGYLSLFFFVYLCLCAFVLKDSFALSSVCRTNADLPNLVPTGGTSAL